MRHVMASLLVAGCVSSVLGAFQARGDAADGTARLRACSLLTHDLAMKVSTAAGRTALEGATPDEGTEDMAIAKGASVCDYGSLHLILNNFTRPEQVRSAMRAGTAPYSGHERVAGVGDEAFFASNSAFANLYVWSGPHHFWIQMASGYGEDTKALKANTVALARAIIPKLR